MLSPFPRTHTRTQTHTHTRATRTTALVLTHPGLLGTRLPIARRIGATAPGLRRPRPPSKARPSQGAKARRGAARRMLPRRRPGAKVPHGARRARQCAGGRRSRPPRRAMARARPISKTDLREPRPLARCWRRRARLRGQRPRRARRAKTRSIWRFTRPSSPSLPRASRKGACAGTQGRRGTQSTLLSEGLAGSAGHGCRSAASSPPVALTSLKFGGAANGSARRGSAVIVSSPSSLGHTAQPAPAPKKTLDRRVSQVDILLKGHEKHNAMFATKSSIADCRRACPGPRARVPAVRVLFCGGRVSSLPSDECSSEQIRQAWFDSEMAARIDPVASPERRRALAPRL